MCLLLPAVLPECLLLAHLVHSRGACDAHGVLVKERRIALLIRLMTLVQGIIQQLSRQITQVGGEARLVLLHLVDESHEGGLLQVLVKTRGYGGDVYQVVRFVEDEFRQTESPFPAYTNQVEGDTRFQYLLQICPVTLAFTRQVVVARSETDMQVPARGGITDIDDVVLPPFHRDPQHILFITSPDDFLCHGHFLNRGLNHRIVWRTPRVPR